MQANFVSGFSKVLPKNEKPVAAHQERLSSMWVRLLVNFSFFAEGQAAIVKTPGKYTYMAGNMAGNKYM